MFFIVLSMDQNNRFPMQILKFYKKNVINRKTIMFDSFGSHALHNNNRQTTTTFKTDVSHLLCLYLELKRVVRFSCEHCTLDLLQLIACTYMCHPLLLHVL